jgi:hypothetical protein
VSTDGLGSSRRIALSAAARQRRRVRVASRPGIDERADPVGHVLVIHVHHHGVFHAILEELVGEEIGTSPHLPTGIGAGGSTAAVAIAAEVLRML